MEVNANNKNNKSDSNVQHPRLQRTVQLYYYSH